MKKIGGLALVAVFALVGCAAPASTGATSEPTPAESNAKIAPLLSVPTPTSMITPQFADASAREKFLAGVKKNWRETALPADDVLVQRGAEACALFDQGLTMGEIGEKGGSTIADWDNAAAIAIYASRVFCTQHNTDNH